MNSSRTGGGSRHLERMTNKWNGGTNGTVCSVIGGNINDLRSPYKLSSEPMSKRRRVDKEGGWGGSIDESLKGWRKSKKESKLEESLGSHSL